MDDKDYIVKDNYANGPVTFTYYTEYDMDEDEWKERLALAWSDLRLGCLLVCSVVAVIGWGIFMWSMFWR